MLDQQEQQQSAPVMKLGEWLITILITAIPIVGIIMLFVWAFGGNTNPNKSNFAKAALIWTAIIMIIYFIIGVVFGAAFFAAAGSNGY